MDYVLHILVMAGIYMILTLSLNLAVGFTGLSALGHAAFFCAGAYASSLLALDYGWSPWLGLPIGAITASVLGVIIGYPSLRVKGDYFALVTFGFGIIIYSIAKNWVALTRGPLGLPGIPPFTFFGYALTEAWAFLPLVLALAVLTYWILHRVTESHYGLILKAVREDEVVAAATGHNVDGYKLTVFVVTAGFAGIAGSLYAHYITFIDPSSFTVNESIAVLLMVVFGGMASLRGSLWGAAILVMLPEALRFVGLPSSVAAPLRQMIYGLLLVLIMLRRPQGLLGTFKWQ